MVSETIGRDTELASLHAFIDEADHGLAGLALEGEAGIGKSTLWLAGVQHARARGLRVFTSRPTEPERTLGNAGLGDLLEGVLDEVLHELSPPRRRALEITLLHEEASGDPVDRRTLAVAVRDTLQLLGERSRTLIAIDDVQWLDAPSSGALSFALRRLDPCPVIVLIARRLVEGQGRSELEQAMGLERVRCLTVGPLSVGALHRFLHGRLGRSFARQTLLRIHERTGGNPFYALELARALPRDIDPLRPFPVPETLDELVVARIAALPPPTREALAFAAALGTPSESLLERAGIAGGALDPALAARIVVRENGLIRFTHPLLSSVLYSDLGDERQRVHERIAEIVEDPVDRARHLALSSHAPDAALAGVLDESVTLATDRGTSAIAAELAEQALRLTPVALGEERRRRALAAARAHLAAGEWTRARTIATDLLAETTGGPLLAEVLLLLAEFEHDDLAVPVLEDALLHAASDPQLDALVQIRLGWAQRFRKGFPASHAATRAALALADRIDDDALRFEALVTLNTLGSMVGDPETPKHAAWARRVATTTGDERMVREANLLYSGDMHTRDTEGQRAKLEHAYEDWHERDELFCARVLWELSWIELWDGRWALAAEHADRAREISAQYGVDRNQDYIPIAWIAAHRGDLERAEAEAERGLKLCEDQIGFAPPLLQAVPGFVALWRGDAATAAARLGDSDRQAQALGWSAPDTRPWTSEYVEALLQLGQIDDAVRIIDRWEGDARRLDADRVLAHVIRCHGLVAAARGVVDEALTLLEQAAARHDEVGDAFGRARALLALGIVFRRARRKRAAREAIEGAIDGFERIGAATWLQKGRDELGHIGGRTATAGLTAAERRVAMLVAEGRTNREVAAALFLAERTVVSHLTRIYSKLGVRSRTELARKVQTF